MGRKPNTGRQAPVGPETSGPAFDRATRLAGALFGGVMAQVTLLRGDKPWRSRAPVAGDAAGVRIAVETGAPLWVEDARSDPRFQSEPAVVGPAGLRFFAAAPILVEDGEVPGAIWVAGASPRPHDRRLAAALEDLAATVADEWARERARRAERTSQRERDAARRMLAGIVAAAPMSLVFTDRRMRVLGASPRWLQNRGLQDEAVIGRSVYDLVPDLFAQWKPAFDRCLLGESLTVERMAVRGDGGDRWVQADVAPWRHVSGRIGGLIMISHDVTEMVDALERTERSKQRLEVALEIADIHVYEMDYVRRELIKVGAEKTFLDVPASYEQLFADIYSTVDPRDRQVALEAWRRHVETGAPFNPEYRMARRDGQEVWAVGTARLITSESGRPLRLIGALQNITARKAQEQALVQAKEEAESANRAKSAFLATMSHEIRTPLNGVLGMAQAMAADTLTPQQRTRVEVIRQSGEGLLAILNDVLDLSKIEAGKLELEQAEFEISELAKGAHATFSAIASAKGLSFDLTVDKAAQGVYVGDSVRIRQILYNLVSNALKFTTKGGVKVGVGRTPGGLTLTVTDTGIGIAPDQLVGLFRKFEQADASTTRRYGGTGLGLAICRDLTAMMQGEIAAASVPRRGSTFTVSLPLKKVRKAVRKPAPPPGRGTVKAAGGRSLRVLAAEDNAMNQLVLRTLLAQIDIHPVMVADGLEALAAWRKQPWDLILMDVQMPRMDGPSAAAEIRRCEALEGRPRTPILALTANAMAHQTEAYRAAGMDGIIPKPIEAGRLYEAVIAAARAPVEDLATDAA